MVSQVFPLVEEGRARAYHHSPPPLRQGAKFVKVPKIKVWPRFPTFYDLAASRRVSGEIPTNRTMTVHLQM